MWDPGGEGNKTRDKLVKINVPIQIYTLVSMAITSSLETDEMMVEPEPNEREESRTELDSHANMPVVGRHAYVISDTGKVADVSPFTPDYDAMKIKIVDAAIQYGCPYSGKSYILVVRNALHVPSMKHNLLPPFILRQAGIEVNDTPKIQVTEATKQHHSIYFTETDLRIPLSLWSTFSYFPSSKPTWEEMQGSDDIYLLTPGNFNPHDSAYALNEDSMMDWEGEMVDRSQRQQILLTEVQESCLTATTQVSSIEVNLVDRILERDESDDEEDVHPKYQRIPKEANEVSSVLVGISPVLDDCALYERMKQRAEIGRFQMSIGSTIAPRSRYLDGDDDTVETEPSTDADSEEDENEEDSDDDEEALLDEILEHAKNGEIDLDEVMASAAHARRPKGIDAKHLSKVWQISHDQAEKTLEATTQHNQRTDDPKLSRNYGTNDRMLRYKRIHDYFFMDTFFATKKAGKSSRGHTCCQLFVTDKGFVHVVPMKAKSDVLQAVKEFAKEIGAPEAIICDAASEQKSEPLRKFLGELGTTLRVLEEGTPWSNKAELYIGLIKEAVRKDMKSSGCPLAFWDYCVERRTRINNLTAKSTFTLHGSNAYTATTSKEGDISNLCQYDWYEWCYFRDHGAGFPFNKEVLGRVLGPSRGEGNEMAQWILKSNGQVVPRRSLRPLKVEETHSEREKEMRRIFDRLIERRWGTAMTPPNCTTTDTDDSYDEYEDDYEDPRVLPDIEDTVDSKGKLLNQMPAYDQLKAEVSLQLGDDMELGKVTQRAVGPDGNVAGTYDDNPMLNTMIYEVEFPDGQVKEYAANLIAENMLTQVDSEGYSTTLMQGIVDFKKDDAVAVSKPDMYVVTPRGQRRMRKTTQGWKLLIQWAGGSESWIALKDMKESHPVEVAEFARARGIHDEPAFAWWVPYVIRKRDVILSKLKARIRKTTHKYGIEVPTSLEHAYEIDRVNKNTIWRDALAKEMLNIGIAFEVLDENKKAPPGWKPVTGHLIWDVKMDFTRKARWVLDGHKTASPVGSTYAGVVSRESVRIGFTYAALNDLSVCAADIRNAYLQAPSSQRDYIVCGPEFGLENVGKVALIHRALYGGKAAGRDFRNHLRSCMRHLDFSPCLADPDVWMRPAKKSNGQDYYEYVLLYTDDALVVAEDAERILRNEIGKYFELKEESIGDPKIYLGGHVRKVQLDNGVECWAFSSSQYVQAAVKNVEEYLDKRADNRWKLPAKAETPIQTSFRPELDVSPELEAVESSYYQSLIGVLRWMVELGRVDICLEVSMLSSHLALPREGHLEQVFHIFAYLKKYHNTEIVYDPSDPCVETSNFERKDWTSSEFGHISGHEELPPNMPEP